MTEDAPKRKGRGICIHEGNLLVIKRINLSREIDQEYYVLPGGKVEDDESLEDAIERETKEEASIMVNLRDLFATMEQDNMHEYFYLCDYVMGEPRLDPESEEAREMEEGIHSYFPMWIPLSQLEEIDLHPKEVKEKILKTHLW